MLDDILTVEDYKKILRFAADIQKVDGNFVEHMLSQICETFNYDVLSFFEVDENGCFCNPCNINFGDHAISLYTEHFYKSDPFYFKNLQGDFCDRDSIYLKELNCEKDFENSEYFVDFFNKYNFSNEIGMYLKIDKRHIGAMGVMRFKESEEFSAKDQALINIITNVISYQYNNYLKQCRLRAKQNWLEKAFYHNPVGVVIADNKFEVIDYNDSAHEFCDNIAPGTNNSLVQRVLIDFLNQNANKNSSGVHKSVSDDYKFEIMKSTADSADAKSQINNYVIYITPNNNAESNKKMKQYPLTKRELQVVELIGRGLTNKEIAEELYISPQTVRTHIDNIMTKTNANNRTDILFKIGKIR